MNNIYNFQKKCEKETYKIAEAQGLMTEDLWPITDGVCNMEAYLSSSPKIMLMLKEPYDKMDANNQPSGGGWSIPTDCFPKDDAWKNRTWQPLIYALYGFRNNLLYHQMDWIRDDKTMSDVLKNIAYINLSKMPGNTNSSESHICSCYAIWKNLIFKQITGYNPDVIIFCGTFRFMEKDLMDDGATLIEQGRRNRRETTLDIYKWKGKILLSTMHPNNKTAGYTREEYVDSIIHSLLKLFKG